MEQIKFENVSFSYLERPEKQVINQVSFSIRQGEYITVCGRSGSGKSTLLKHCKSVLTPSGITEGTIYFEGKPLTQVSLCDQTAKIGYVMQNPENQIVTDKVWHELAFGLESLGYDNQAMRRLVAEMANFFGMQNWMQRDVKDLSGGEKQLLNLASIMVMHPQVLILDEPTSQLDPIAASNFLGIIRKIHIELGTTILISEHRLEEVLPCSDKVAVLEDGRLTAFGTPLEIGNYLWEQWKQNSNQKNACKKMFAAMPSAMQIFYRAGGSGKAPLTVLEGKKWMKEYVKDASCYKVQTKSIPVSEEPTLLKLKDVWFQYDKNQNDVLRGVNLEVREKEIFALIGGNGTGKTTTLHVIAHLLKPSSGKVIFQGKDIWKRKRNTLEKNTVALLPQDPHSLFVKHTVREELEEMSQDENEIGRIAKFMEIVELLDHHPYDLSGGELQRAAFAKVLLLHPKLLLLDEPTKGMDVFFCKKLANMLKELRDQGMTIILISHDIEFCAQYADRVSLFFDGTVVSTDTAKNFFIRNHFYTTASHRICRDIWQDAVTIEDAVELCKNVKNEKGRIL